MLNLVLVVLSLVSSMEKEEGVRRLLSNVRFHMEIALLRFLLLYAHSRATALPLDLATKTKQTTFEGPSKATKHHDSKEH